MLGCTVEVRFFYVTTGGLGRFIVYNVIGGKEGYKLALCALECSASTVTSIERKLLFEVPQRGRKHRRIAVNNRRDQLETLPWTTWGVRGLEVRFKLSV